MKRKIFILAVMIFFVGHLFAQDYYKPPTNAERRASSKEFQKTFGNITGDKGGHPPSIPLLDDGEFNLWTKDAGEYISLHFRVWSGLLKYTEMTPPETTIYSKPSYKIFGFVEWILVIGAILLIRFVVRKMRKYQLRQKIPKSVPT